MASEPHSVLVVDDEENVRRALQRSLHRENYRIFTAADPDQAFEILRTSRIDLIISDHMMPKMTGLDFIKKVKVMYPGIIRIILTGHASTEMVISAINEGEIYRFLTKPWDDLELKVMLRNAMEKLELERDNRLLLMAVRKQMDLLTKVEQESPGAVKAQKDPEGVFVIEDVDMDELKNLLEIKK